MKTNHQRGFIDSGSFRDRSMEVFTSKLTGQKAYIGNDFCKGHRGHSRAIHGAKKRMRSTDRLYLKAHFE